MTRLGQLRRRRWSTAVLAAVLLGCALLAGVGPAVSKPTGAAAEPRLPTVVNAPGTWSGELNRTGPVAAIGLADRTFGVGLTDERTELWPFSTSAVDGRSTWLDLPGFSVDHSGLVGGIALSPDGRWIGWVRAGKGRAIKGWSVRDTTTGRVRHLSVAGHPRVRPVMNDLAFSSDSQHLLTSHENPSAPRRGGRNHEFVAWSVADGTPTVLEEPGFYWLPSLGSADTGVVWSRNDQVFRADLETGRRTTVTLPRTVHMASWGPGDDAFAYIGRDKPVKGGPDPEERLYVGTSPQTATRVVDLPDTSPIGEALAWRDATHVVVGNYRRSMYVVDITDGSHETLDMAGSGSQINTPTLATALWSKPLREPVAPTGTDDPRRWWRWAGLAVFGALLALGATLLRRADRAARSRPATAPNDQPETISPTTQLHPPGTHLPLSAWALTWLFLAGQVTQLLTRGANPSGAFWVLVSMALSAVLVRWCADGVLRARTGRLALVWIVLSAATGLGVVGLGVHATEANTIDLLAVAFSPAQLLALGFFSTSRYFQDRRTQPNVPGAALTPLLWIAIATGLLGGLTASTPSGESFPQLTITL